MQSSRIPKTNSRIIKSEFLLSFEWFELEYINTGGKKTSSSAVSFWGARGDKFFFYYRYDFILKGLIFVLSFLMKKKNKPQREGPGILIFFFFATKQKRIRKKKRGVKTSNDVSISLSLSLLLPPVICFCKKEGNSARTPPSFFPRQSHNVMHFGSDHT